MDHHLARLASGPAVLTLIGIDIVVFVAQLIRSDVAEALVLHSGGALPERPWTLVTVFFLHEPVVLISLAAGFVGSLAIVLTSAALGSDERLVGSSTAFHGIVAAYLALQPDAVTLGSKAKTWLIVLVVANLVLMFPTDFTPLSGAGYLARLAVGFLYGRQRCTADEATAGTLPTGGNGRRRARTPEATDGRGQPRREGRVEVCGAVKGRAATGNGGRWTFGCVDVPTCRGAIGSRKLRCSTWRGRPHVATMGAAG